MANKRQQIMDAVKARLQNITVANGYMTNLGNNVYEWKETAFAENEMPGIDYRDALCERFSSVLNRFRWRLSVGIEIATQNSTAVSDVRKMIADVYKVIGTDDTWGGLAIITEQPESDEMRVTKEERFIAGALIGVFIIYETSLWEN